MVLPVLSYFESRVGYLNRCVAEFLANGWPRARDEVPETSDLLDRNLRVRLNNGTVPWCSALMLVCCDSVGGGSKIVDIIPIIEVLHAGSKEAGDNDIWRYIPYRILRHMMIPPRLKLRVHELIAEEMLHYELGRSMKDVPRDPRTFHKHYYSTRSVIPRLSAKLGALFGEATRGQMNSLGRYASALALLSDVQTHCGLLKCDFVHQELHHSLVYMYMRNEDPVAVESAFARNDLSLVRHLIDRAEMAAIAEAQREIRTAWTSLDPLLPETSAKRILYSLSHVPDTGWQT
jgi:hypothetical protein